MSSDIGQKIVAAIGESCDIGAIRDGLAWYKENYDEYYVEQIRKKCVLGLKKYKKEEYFACYRLGLLISAPHRFDQYMQYLEIDRRPKDRFYLPRREVLFPFVQALQELADGRLDELFLSQPPRTGKALADDTPILTRKGWKNHGDLVVGDEVIGMDGKFKKVIRVMPKCELDVLMEFSNGEKIQCHENHEWLLYDRAKQDYTLRETHEYEEQKLDSGEAGHRGHRYRFQLPHKKPIQGRKKKLPLDPYTLGVWLGDGTNQDPRIANAESDRAIIDKIIANGTPVRWQTKHKTTGVMYYNFDIRKQLQQMGMCYSRQRTPKHIPEEYLTASLEQRLELLAGLIDTDGTFRRSENRYVFSTCEETLRDTFLELIATFDWRPSVVVYEPKLSSSGVQGKKRVYAVGFNPDMSIPCALERKRIDKFSKQRAVALTKISRVEPKQGNCITVEGDGMYLAGRTMIPTHNTSTAMFYMTWCMGRDTEKANLYCAYSDTITTAFYNGVLEIITDDHTYKFGEVFPNAAIAKTDAKQETIDLGRAKRYPSFTARSLYGTLNGAVDCNGVQIADDLIGGIEEALNKDRLMSAWSKVDNNYLPRAKQGAKRLWIGTRWSLIDPIGIRQDIIANSKYFRGYKWKSMNIPALDEKDMSNFNYKYNVGFDTRYYRQRRASFERNGDLASWNAQFMGMPIEREGTVFSPDELNYYNGQLPDGDADKVFVAVDPAWGGGDYVAAPLCYQYGEEIYVADVVYNNGDKSKTQPKVAKMAMDGGCSRMYIEGTKTTASYGEGILDILKKANYPINLRTSFKNALGGAAFGKNKEERIYQSADEIKKRFIFLEEGKRTKEYQMFMQNVFSFKIVGKNKNDDAPDSLQMALTFAFPPDTARSAVLSRSRLGF